MKVDYPTYLIGIALQAIWLLAIGCQLMYGKNISPQAIGFLVLIAGFFQVIIFIFVVLAKEVYWNRKGRQ